ncbi:MAG: hypothetical protein WCI72_02785 [archaeon]
MAQVSFGLFMTKDAWNIWDKANGKMQRFGQTTIPPSLIAICKGKTFEESKQEILKFNQRVYTSGIIESFIISLEDYWSKIEGEFFRRLAKMTGNSFEDKITGQITTIGTCPYNPEKSTFMVSLFSHLPSAICTCAHEIMHLHFHKFDFARIEKQIGTEKTHDLREALTVLLNLEFRDLLIGGDKGYEQHLPLRKFIVTEWEKENDYPKLLDKCVEYFKNNKYN